MKQEENCALLGYYAASSGVLLPTFRGKLLVPLINFKIPGFSTLIDGLDRLSRNVVRNYPYSLRNASEERGFFQLRSGNLK